MSNDNEDNNTPAWADPIADFSLPEYDIAPEDQSIADEIRAMDYVADVPSNVTVKGDFKLRLPDELPLTSLPPETQARIEAQLLRTPASKVAETQRDLVAKAYKELALEARIKTGVSSSALPWHRVAYEQAAEQRRLAAEFNKNTDRLVEVQGYRKVTDPVTGEFKSEPVLALSAAQQRSLLNRQTEITHQLQLLDGVEGQRAMRRALFESVELIKAQRAMVAENAEVDRRADEILREERLDAKARAKASFKRHTV